MRKQETKQERKYNTIGTIIFEQMPPKKPNAGKPVQRFWGFIIIKQ